MRPLLSVSDFATVPFARVDKDGRTVPVNSGISYDRESVAIPPAAPFDLSLNLLKPLSCF